MMKPATLEEVRALTVQLYDKIWSDWYSVLPSAQKATIEVSLADHSAGFSPSRNLLINPICEGNLEDYNVRDIDGWPIWKIQLVHEMIHEWQYKKPCVPTVEATELHSRLGKKFEGRGHGQDFFQALLEKAPYFGMSPEQLINTI